MQSLYYARKAAVHGVKRLLGMPHFARRYSHLFSEIDRSKPRNILEIGTNDGLNAVRLYQAASRHRDDVHYYGFDLFEEQDSRALAAEFALPVPPLAAVKRYLAGKNVRFDLYPGNTRDTLASTDLPKMDLVFIDGGHSFGTVSSDWQNVQRLLHADSVVYFDDYPHWGVGQVVDAIRDRQVEIMPTWDEFPTPRGGRRRFRLARVSGHATASTPEPAAYPMRGQPLRLSGSLA